MNHRLSALLLAVALHVLMLAPANAQVSQTQIAYDLAVMQDPAWQNRSAAFYDLLKQVQLASSDSTYVIPAATAALLEAAPAQADAIRLGLINALALENPLANGTTMQLPEEYTEYYADLIAAVATLRDPRAVNALIGAVESGGMATGGLGKLGSAAYGPTVALLSSSKDDSTRESALYVLSAMLDGLAAANPEGKGLQVAIANHLRRGLSDASFGVRMAALDGIAKLPADSPTLQKLEAMAAADPYEASQAGGDRGVFPVRGAAKRALAKLGAGR